MNQALAISQIGIPALDGLLLAGTLYQCGDHPPPAHAVIICGAMGIARHHYDTYAKHLCEQGFTVVTFDYRGIGGSCPASLRRFAASMRTWGEQDIAGVIEWALGQLHADKLMVVGHSAGGQLLGLAHNARRIHAMVQVTVPSGYWRHWPAPNRYAFALLWYVFMPGLSRLLGYFPARAFRLGDDLPAGVALEWARWCRHADYMFGHLDDGAVKQIASLDLPVLSYSFADDTFAPKAAVNALLQGFAALRVERIHITPSEIGSGPIGHFGFFRPRFADSLWRESTAWLKQR